MKVECERCNDIDDLFEIRFFHQETLCRNCRGLLNIILQKTFNNFMQPERLSEKTP